MKKFSILRNVAIAFACLAATVFATTGCATQKKGAWSGYAVTLNKSSQTIKVGDSFTLSVTKREPTTKLNVVYRWKSSDATVATVDYETGVVKAVSAGTAEIWVYCLTGDFAVPLAADGTPVVNMQSLLNGEGDAVCKVKVKK
jgi:uncharacterized protein YjdB